MEPERRRRDDERDHTKLNIWVTFAGTILAALIGGIFAFVVARDDEPAAAPATTATPPWAPATGSPTAPSRSTTGPATTEPRTTTPTGSASEDWTGKLTVASTAIDNGLDLDLRPPESIDNASRHADVNARVASRTRAIVFRSAFSPAKVALWEGDGVPQFAECRDTATTQGVNRLSDLPAGTVICVRTSDGHIARLTVRRIGSPSGTVTFDAAVWKNP